MEMMGLVLFKGCFRVACLVSLVQSVAPPGLSVGFYGKLSFHPGGYLAAVFMPLSLVHWDVYTSLL